MAINRIELVLFLAVFAIFLDHGDGRWREKDKEKIKQDIKVFRQIADEIELEIEDFYDEYSEVMKNINEKVETENQRPQVVSFINRDTKANFDKQLQMKTTSQTGTMGQTGQIIRNDLFQHQPVNNEPCCNTTASPNSQGHKEQIGYKPIGWPRFDDMLLAIGKKYDWKNDRWIKVKQKTRSDSDSNSISFKEKHNFSYRIVKLNRSKSKRNIVIAVKAVR